MHVCRYELCADEAWTHTSLPLNRYWCFFGGIFGRESDSDRLETALRAAVAATGIQGEVKWSSVTETNLPAYKRLVDVFFSHIRDHNLVYRQIFLDRAFVHVSDDEVEDALSSLDIQFRVYYQFIKHSFGLEYLCATDPQKVHHVTLRLDSHSSQRHTANLTDFVESLRKVLGTPKLVLTVQFVNSKRFLRLQLCDVIMGAAGSHGNKMHLRREVGRRGMTKKQKARHGLAKYIYDHFRALDATERGSKAFNWFESTGHDGDRENRLKHKLRIWKFIPRRYQIDAGWHNDHLDSQGRYQKPDILPTVIDQSRSPFQDE